MCSLTVGGSALAYSGQGIYGPMESILYPINHGIFGFVGFTVIEPFVVFAPARATHDERLAVLAQYRRRVLELETAPAIAGPNIADYEGLVLKSALHRPQAVAGR